ncbi:MAG: tRNA lysidine(34) synthetase TilS [Candidatus Geothermincolales bacterium]
MPLRWQRERFLVLEKVRLTLRRWDMLGKGDLVLVAVSGGADSLCLLDVMAQLSPRLDLRLHVVHVDHGLRPESAEDAEFVREVAAYYRLPCRVAKVRVERGRGRGSTSPEEAARRARYQAFEEAARELGADRVATGHTADDRAETLLLRLLTGAGPEGLRSIPPVRGIYIRPLIEVFRSEVETYVHHLPFKPRLDVSNLDLRVPRNRVRHELLPLLERRYNPAVKEVLCREADTLYHMVELVEERAEELEQRAVTRLDDEVVIDRNALLEAPVLLQRQVIARSLRRAGGEADYHLVEELRRRFLEGEENPWLDIGPGLVARRVYDRIVLGPRPAPGELEEVKIDGEGIFQLPGWTLRVTLEPWEGGDPRKAVTSPLEALLDAERLRFPLRVRGVRPGDRFHPLGAPGTRKLQDFLVDLKVPLERRKDVAVLESDGEIAWVMGMRIDDRFKVTPDTRRVARMRLYRDRMVSLGAPRGLWVEE